MEAVPRSFQKNGERCRRSPGEIPCARVTSGGFSFRTRVSLFSTGAASRRNSCVCPRASGNSKTPKENMFERGSWPGLDLLRPHEADLTQHHALIPWPGYWRAGPPSRTGGVGASAWRCQSRGSSIRTVRDEDVVGLEVAMNDPRLVSRGAVAGDLQRVVEVLVHRVAVRLRGCPRRVSWSSSSETTRPGLSWVLMS